MGTGIYNYTWVITYQSLEVGNCQRSLECSLWEACENCAYSQGWHVSRMYEMKCEDDSNICTHLKALLQMQEQLMGMEAGQTDDDFITVILISLPKSYWPLVNMILLSLAIVQTQLKPDAVVSSLLDE